MKHKISAVFLSVALCLSCLCVCSAPARASGLQTVKPTFNPSSNSFLIAADVFVDFLKEQINSLVSEYQKKIEATRIAYFYYMLVNGLNSSYDIIENDRFTNDYLYSYFRPYGLANEYGGINNDISELGKFMLASGFTDKWSYYDLSFSTYPPTFYLCCYQNEVYNETVENYFQGQLLGKHYVFREFRDYYNGLLCKLLVKYDWDNITVNLDTQNKANQNLNDIAPPLVSSDDLKQELEKQNNTIDPKNRSMLKYSWRDLSNNQDNVDWSCFARNVVDGCKTCVGSSLMEDGMYIQVYMRRNGYMYYTPYQYHMYADVENILNEDNIVTASKYNVYLDPIYYQTVNGESLDTFQYKAFTWDNFYDNANSGHIYFSLGFNVQNGTSVQGIRLYTYDSLGNCVKNLNITHCFWFSALCETGSTSSSGLSTSIYRENWNYFLRSDDVDNKIDIRTGIKHFFKDKVYGIGFTNFPIYTHDNGVRPPGDSHAGASLDNCVICDEGNTCDFGFLISSEQFTTTYQFDTTRLPSNSTVTISGDSVYDYSITDNSTGETSTIYNYVTNNYSYPETSGGNTSGGNGGGTVGGNITVGGQVDVGGKVDINVNVNGNGDNYSMPDTSGMNDYLESALDDSSGFRKFLKVFFDFLPPPILVLLGTALTCAIIARLCGR